MADDYGLSAKAGGLGYERLRTGLEAIESSNNPGAIQRHTKAVGFYQFIPRYWDKWVKKETGRDLSSFLPKDGSPAEMERAAKEQREILFPKYYEKEMAPWIANMRKKGLGKGQSDLELAVTFHKLGDQHAEKYLRTGYDASAGTVDNTGIRQYVNMVVKKATGKSPSGTINPNATVSAMVQVTQTRGQPTTGSMSASPEATGNDAVRVLAELRALRGMIGGADGMEDFEQRLRKEGAGV